MNIYEWVYSFLSLARNNLLLSKEINKNNISIQALHFLEKKKKFEFSNDYDSKQ